MSASSVVSISTVSRAACVLVRWKRIHDSQHDVGVAAHLGLKLGYKTQLAVTVWGILLLSIGLSAVVQSRLRAYGRLC
jgi:hypothetical protein